MFSTVVNISKVFGNLKLRGNSKVRRSHLGHSNNHHYVLLWHNGAAIQSGKCIAFTHIANFKGHSQKISTCNTNEAARTLFTDRWNKTSWSCWRTSWISIKKTRKWIPIFSSHLDIDAWPWDSSASLAPFSNLSDERYLFFSETAASPSQASLPLIRKQS